MASIYSEPDLIISKRIATKTKKTTFIIAKLKKSDDQTYIHKYRVAANITEYHSISKYKCWLLQTKFIIREKIYISIIIVYFKEAQNLALQKGILSR